MKDYALFYQKKGYFNKLKIILEKNLFYNFKKFFYLYIVKLFYPIVRQKKFIFQEKELEYFNHSYNNTHSNERCIEIPIALSFINLNNKRNILEVGNVLSHYIQNDWDVIDRYEKGEGVINQDAAIFNANKKYDLIISISTLEHIGYDETPKVENKPLQTLKNLQKFLSPRGILIATIPLAYNRYLDTLIFNERKNLFKVTYFKRTSWKNHWEKVSKDRAKNIEYGSPFPGANGLCVLLIKK